MPTINVEADFLAIDNLQTVTVPTPDGGTKKIKIAARMITSRAFKAILAGEKALPKGV